MKQYISILFISILISCQGKVEDLLQDKTYVETLPQKIGGKLICNVHYWDDFQQAVHEIKYTYVDKNGINYNLGSGKFEKGWNKEEQLIQIKKWTILHTENSRNSDKLIIGDMSSNEWNDFIISPDIIEEIPIWKEKDIDSSPNNYDSTAKITKLKNNGEFIVTYKFAIKDRTFNFQNGERKLHYKLNFQTGIPKLVKIGT
ncbi:hypothetical protein [Flavobacterium sp.]|uniref:hypothetical protein n=1 Tax=Flavobacterium sp. TaxID=239 RepID=UPI0039E6569C